MFFFFFYMMLLFGYKHAEANSSPFFSVILAGVMHDEPFPIIIKK